jgi:hypothetical protein
MGTRLPLWQVAFVLPALFMCSPAQAATHTATANVALLEKLSLLKTADLDFGWMVAGPTAGTVTVGGTVAAPTRTSTGGVTPTPSSFHPAEFRGYGDRNQRVFITVVISPPNYLTRVSGTEQMLLDNFTITAGSGIQNNGPAGRFKINPGSGSTGLFDFTVGGRLNVGAGQTPGAYRGTFTVSVVYQ